MDLTSGHNLYLYSNVSMKSRQFMKKENEKKPFWIISLVFDLGSLMNKLPKQTFTLSVDDSSDRYHNRLDTVE